jgi:hypothetical protein
MGMLFEDVEREALQLDHRDRARLAEALLRSLDALSRDELDTIWAEEAERRSAEMEANPDACMDLEVNLRHLRTRPR